MDINFDGIRHTFTVGKDWSVMKKQRINDHLDMLFCETEFRFSFNKEQKLPFDKEKLRKIFTSGNKYSIRLKNITKF